MGQDFRRTYRPPRRGRCGAALHAWRPGPWLCTHTRIKPKAERASVVEASSFSSLGVRHHLILGTLRHANCEFAARIGAVLPAKSLFARAADAKLHAGEGEGSVGEHASADQKVIGVAVFLLATVCGRGGLRLGGRSSFLNS